MSGQFRFLEDVALADAAFDADGESPSELFTAAARAVIETMVNPGTVSARVTHDVTLQAPDIETLLFDWLSQIVFLKDAKQLVVRDVTAVVAQTRPGDGRPGEWSLDATLTGEPIDQRRHELRADVKAVTKHLYQVRQEGGRWFARVVLDI
jgi:SHS2 domain-containing protein